MRCVHPSRRLLRKLLRMRSENILTTSLAGGFCCHAVYRVTIHASIRRSRALMMPTNASLTGVVTPSGLPKRGIAPLMASTSHRLASDTGLSWSKRFGIVQGMPPLKRGRADKHIP
jgi:hypothetical protein